MLIIIISTGIKSEDGRNDSTYAEFEEKFGYGLSPEIAYILQRLGV